MSTTAETSVVPERIALSIQALAQAREIILDGVVIKSRDGKVGVQAVAPITDREVYDALCVCEWICDSTIEGEFQRDEWIEFREAVGSIELRAACLDYGRWCAKVLAICISFDAQIFDGYAYDWDVIPAIMGRAVDDDGRPVLPVALPEPSIVAPLVFRQFDGLRR